MSKRENRKAYYKAREKEYLALERKRNEEYQKTFIYDYVELEEPIHIGYVKYYDIAPSLIGTKAEPNIRYILDRFQYEAFSKNKNFISGKGRNRRLIVPQLRSSSRDLDIPSDVRNYLNIRFEHKGIWIPGIGYLGDYFMSFVSDSYYMIKIRKEYNYYQAIVDSEAISNYQFYQDKIYYGFRDYLGDNCPRFWKKHTRRKLRQKNKSMLDKAIKSNDFNNIYNETKFKSYYWW